MCLSIFLHCTKSKRWMRTPMRTCPPHNLCTQLMTKKSTFQPDNRHRLLRTQEQTFLPHTTSRKSPIASQHTFQHCTVRRLMHPRRVNMSQQNKVHMLLEKPPR